MFEDEKLVPTARGRRTRDALVRAAKEVFEEVGLDEARISDITARAGTSYGSFYTYFDSKEAVFKGVLTSVIGEMFITNRGTEERGSPQVRIERSIRGFFVTFSKNASALATLGRISNTNEEFQSLQLQVRSLFLARNERVIRELQEAGRADLTLDPQLTATALAGMIEQFAIYWFVFKQEYDDGEVVRTLTRLYMQALGVSDDGLDADGSPENESS